MDAAIGAEEAIAKVMALPREERLRVANDLIMSIGEGDQQPISDMPELSLSDEQLDELDRRLRELKADPSIGISHEEVWKRLRGSDAS